MSLNSQWHGILIRINEKERDRVNLISILRLQIEIIIRLEMQFHRLNKKSIFF